MIIFVGERGRESESGNVRETCARGVEACLPGLDRRVNRIEIGHCFGNPRFLEFVRAFKKISSSRESSFDFRYTRLHVILIRLADYPRRFARSSGAGDSFSRDGIHVSRK